MGMWLKCHVMHYYYVQQIATSKLNSGKPRLMVLCLNQEEGHAEAVKIMRFIHRKSIVVFHCPLGMLQDFCNLL